METGVVGRVCPSLEGAENTGVDKTTGGKGDEALAIGNEGEEGVRAGGRCGSAGLKVAGLPTTYVWLKSTEEGEVRASASAAAMEEALGKRAAGSFARLRRITADKASEMDWLMRTGGGGMVLTWCIIMVCIVSPWNGRMPVQIS